MAETLMFQGNERLVADPSVTVDMIERDLEEWLSHCNSRDILGLLSVVQRTCGMKLAPSTCVSGIVSVAKLMHICLQRCPNGVLPRKTFSLAVRNIHQRNPVYHGEACIVIKADDITGIIRCALAKVRRRPVFHTGAYAHRACTRQPSTSILRPRLHASPQRATHRSATCPLRGMQYVPLHRSENVRSMTTC